MLDEYGRLLPLPKRSANLRAQLQINRRLEYNGITVELQTSIIGHEPMSSRGSWTSAPFRHVTSNLTNSGQTVLIRGYANTGGTHQYGNIRVYRTRKDGAKAVKWKADSAMVTKTYFNGDDTPAEEQNIWPEFDQLSLKKIYRAPKKPPRKFKASHWDEVAEVSVYERMADNGKMGFLKFCPREEGTAEEDAALERMSDEELDNLSSIRLQFFKCKLSKQRIPRVAANVVTDDNSSDNGEDSLSLEDRLRTRGLHPRLEEYIQFGTAFIARGQPSECLNREVEVEKISEQEPHPCLEFQIIYKSQSAMRETFPRSASSSEGEDEEEGDTSDLTDYASGAEGDPINLSSDEEAQQRTKKTPRQSCAKTLEEIMNSSSFEGIEIPALEVPSSPRKRKRQATPLSEDSGMGGASPRHFVAASDSPYTPVASTSSVPATPLGRLALGETRHQQIESARMPSAGDSPTAERESDEEEGSTDPHAIKVNLHMENGSRKTTVSYSTNLEEKLSAFKTRIKKRYMKYGCTLSYDDEGLQERLCEKSWKLCKYEAKHLEAAMEIFAVAKQKRLKAEVDVKPDIKAEVRDEVKDEVKDEFREPAPIETESPVKTEVPLQAESPANAISARREVVTIKDESDEEITPSKAKRKGKERRVEYHDEIL